MLRTLDNRDWLEIDGNVAGLTLITTTGARLSTARKYVVTDCCTLVVGRIHMAGKSRAVLALGQVLKDVLLAHDVVKHVHHVTDELC